MRSKNQDIMFEIMNDFLFPESNMNCTSKLFEGYNILVDDEGNTVDGFYGSEDKCKQFCFDNDDCKSLTYCRNGDAYNCHLKDKVLINNGENKMNSSHHPYCTSYIKTCEGIKAYKFWRKYSMISLIMFYRN